MVILSDILTPLDWLFELLKWFGSSWLSTLWKYENEMNWLIYWWIDVLVDKKPLISCKFSNECMNVVKLYVAKELKTCTCYVIQYPSDVWKSQRIHLKNTKIFQ